MLEAKAKGMAEHTEKALKKADNAILPEEFDEILARPSTINLWVNPMGTPKSEGGEGIIAEVRLMVSPARGKRQGNGYVYPEAKRKLVIPEDMPRTFRSVELTAADNKGVPYVGK